MSREWWEGDQAAPTTGYGTFDSRPAAREPAILEELIGDDPGGEEQKMQPHVQQQVDAANRNIMIYQGRMIGAPEHLRKQLVEKMQREQHKIQSLMSGLF